MRVEALTYGRREREYSMRERVKHQLCVAAFSFFFCVVAVPGYIYIGNRFV